MAELDLSILDRVKKRLYGAENPEIQDTQNDDSTQPILLRVADTQVIPSFELSILFAPAKEDSGAIRLPQLGLEDVEFAPQKQPDAQNDAETQEYTETQKLPEIQETQVIALVSGQMSMFAEPLLPGDKISQESTGEERVLAEFTQENEENVELTREEKLARLVQKKRQQRILEEEQLEAEIRKTTLSDEEQDLDDAADTTRDSLVQKNATTKKELEEIDRFLSEQKRNRTIQPAFEKREIDPMQQLVAAFDSDSDQENAMTSDRVLRLSPTTSPMKVVAEKETNESNDSDLEFDTTNVLDMIATSQLPVKVKRNPIDDYAQRLKKQLVSSPTRAAEGLITLDDSADETAPESADVPKLTKEQHFVLKRRYSKKKLAKLKQNVTLSKFHQPQSQQRVRLYEDLRAANAKQLNEIRANNPDAELMEEIEKEEEEMGNLLEREMERVRRIRKKEKLQEKAKLALLSGTMGDDEEDGDYKEHDQEEVPDSDIGSGGSGESGESDFDDSNSESEEESEKINRTKRVVLSDDEDEEQEEAFTTRHDDSYMFGGKSDEIEHDDDVMQIQAGNNEPSLVNVVDHVDHDTDLHELFLNLAPRKESDVSFDNSVNDDSLAAIPEAPSFMDITETQEDLATQADSIDLSTKNELGESTQIDVDSDEDLPSALSRGRRFISKNALESVQELEDEDEVDEEDEKAKQELLKEKLALFEAKIRRKELKARRLRKEMERKGIKNMVEGEAEESDDEWKGIGGADEDGSDHANSEDERMIDNDFNIDLNDEEVRKKFMEQYQIKDRKELEKLIDDIKNHKLTKRARASGFDVELSDEEDELLMAYRRQKLQEQKQRLLANQKLMKLALNEKSRAFFESIQDDIVSIALDEQSEGDLSESESEKNQSQSTEPDTAEAAPKKVIRIGEAFVQRQLSFLSRTEHDDYNEIQRLSNRQHGMSDDEVDDLATLKSRSLSNLYTRSTTPELVRENAKRGPETVETDDDEDEDCFSRVFKKPSIVGSFRSFQEKQGVQVSSKSFSGVTVSKQYKVASGSKASITYLSKTSRQKSSTSIYQNSKSREIEESIGRAHRENNVLFRSGGTFS